MTFLAKARRFSVLVVALGGLGFVVPIQAQEDTGDYQAMSDNEQKDFLTRLVQDQLSTPERQISISNIDGVLGSDVSINEITISDAEGVWLRVTNARLNWNQAALFLGRLEVRSLSADSIEYVRNAIPVEGMAGDLPAPEAGGFEVPEFPVAIQIDELSVPSVTFGEDVFGLGSEISLAGRLTLEGGNLDTALDIVRQDGPGGTLDVDVTYANETETVDIAVVLNEPEDGILANLLNIEGRPAVELSLAGSGAVSDLTTELVLSASGQTALSGVATLDQTDAGLMIAADLRGALAELIAAPYRPFFGAETSLIANALLREGGGVTVSGLRLSGGQLSLEASAETTTDNFLRQLTLDAVIADPAGAEVILPVPGSSTRIDRAQFSIDYGAEGSEDWLGQLSINGLDTPGIATETVVLNLGGVAANLDNPLTRMVTVNGDGQVSGISASEEIEAALGDAIGLGVAGLWEAGQPIQIAEFRIAGEALEAALSGTFADFMFTGDIAIETASIAPFSGLAGREVSGGLTLAANGSLSPLSGGFDLTLDGTGTGLSIDDVLVDRLLEGTVSLAGRVARTEAGLTAEGFRLANDQVQLTADGTYATGAADFVFNADLADLALVSEDASGAVSVVGRATGQDGLIDLDLDISAPSGQLAERALRDGLLAFDGRLDAGRLDGNIIGSASLDGFRVDLAADVSVTDTERRIVDIAFETAGARLTGGLSQGEDGLIDGTLSLAAPDVSVMAALGLVDATGAVNAEVVLTPQEGRQGATVRADVRNLVADDVRVGSATIDASVMDLFGVPAIDGQVNGSAITAAGLDITTLAASAQQTGATTRFDARASLATGTDLDVAGSLTPEGEGYRLALDRADLAQGDLSARLANPTVLVVDGTTVALDQVRFLVGSGSITASGSAGENLDIDVLINALPLSIANAVVPDLGLAGTINGQAQIGGTGSDPQVAFAVQGSGLNAAAISEFGIAPLALTAEGSFADGTVRLASVSAQGTGGLQLAGSGVVPLDGGGLAVNVTGSAPLTLANRFVADRGGQASGVVNLNAAITGSLAAPQFSGTVTTSGASYIDPETNLRLNTINASIALSGTEARIASLSAVLATGGTVSGSGTIGLTGQLPANIALNLNSARYADGNLFVATASGNLAVTGNLLGNPLLSGNVLIERADITVPDSFGGGVDLIDVEHIAIPPAVAATLDRARIDEGGAPVPASRAPGLLLDVMVNAPNQIFVRGRGLDAELEGSVRLTGPLNDIQPVGGFSLTRGRLAILGQRIDFESGSVTLVGDLDPFINLTARTEGDGITVFVTVSGRVSEVEVSFTSNPALPQDEVLSRLIFNRSVGELSPLQLARLAGAAAELAGGGGGPGPLDALREAAGLADLDVVTDDQGNVGVQAGAYIQENVYLGVTAGANGDSRVTINLDVTDELTVQGAAGADGDSSLGVYYEEDY